MAESQTVQITIWNEAGIDLDRGMLDFAMRKVAQHAPQAESISVFPGVRFNNGPNYPEWLEWIVRVTYRRGGQLTIGCIQRSPGAEFESHT